MFDHFVCLVLKCLISFLKIRLVLIYVLFLKDIYKKRKGYSQIGECKTIIAIIMDFFFSQKPVLPNMLFLRNVKMMNKLVAISNMEK